MEQRASSLQQRLEARRNMFLAAKPDGGGGGSGPSSIGAPQSTYTSSRTGRNQIEYNLTSYYQSSIIFIRLYIFK